MGDAAHAGAADGRAAGGENGPPVRPVVHAPPAADRRRGRRGGRARHPVYREIRIALPRQSGKTLFALSETLDRLLGWSVEPQRSVYTAQSRLAARAKLEEYYEIVRKGPLDPLIAFRRQTGMESFRCANGSTLELSATEQASGHGPTLDQAVLDECWAQLDSRLEAAARPAMSTRPEAQMFLLSTAGTEESLWWRSKIDDGRARAEAGQRSGVAFSSGLLPMTTTPTTRPPGGRACPLSGGRCRWRRSGRIVTVWSRPSGSAPT